MSEAVVGGCLCTKVRFQYTGEVGNAAYCHCEDCRRCTGSAFNISLGFDTDKFEITSGAVKEFIATADSGNVLTRHFCGDCGSPIFTSSVGDTAKIYIKAGVLDNPDLVKPVHQSWTSSAVSWSKIKEGVSASEKG